MWFSPARKRRNTTRCPGRSKRALPTRSTKSTWAAPPTSLHLPNSRLLLRNHRRVGVQRAVDYGEQAAAFEQVFRKCAVAEIVADDSVGVDDEYVRVVDGHLADVGVFHLAGVEEHGVRDSVALDVRS